MADWPRWLVSNHGRDKRFSFSKTVQTGSDAHPVFYSMGAGAHSTRVKRPEREVDRSPLPSAEDNNEWIYNPGPFMSSWCGQGQF